MSCLVQRKGRLVPGGLPGSIRADFRHAGKLSLMARSPRGVEKSRRYVPSRQRASALHPRVFWALLRKTVSKWNDDPTIRFGAGLAFYTAFAVVPLVFIVVELATVMFGQGAAEALLLEEVERLIGQQGAEAVGQLLESWQKNGVGTLAAGGSGRPL